MVVGRDGQNRPHLVGLREDPLRDHRAERRGRGRRRVKEIGMEETKLERSPQRLSMLWGDAALTFVVRCLLLSTESLAALLHQSRRWTSKR